MTDVQEPTFIAKGADAPRQELPFVERDAITAIVRNPKTGKYLGLRWKKVDWDTFITGGPEGGQTAEEGARMEVREESGYKNLKLIEDSWRDSYWGWGPNKDGNNHLGKLWMEVRKEVTESGK